MRSLITKALLFLLFTICYLLFAVPVEAASAPKVAGTVKNQAGAPIPGVWVKWVDNVNSTCICITGCGEDETPTCRTPTQATRYAQTDANGRYSFDSWQWLNQGARDNLFNTMLDPYNRSPENRDTRLADTTTYHGFGCGEVPHRLSVVKPANDNGSFAFDDRCFPAGTDQQKCQTAASTAGCGGRCDYSRDCEQINDGANQCYDNWTLSGTYYNQWPLWPQKQSDDSVVIEMNNDTGDLILDFVYTPGVSPTPSTTPTNTPAPTPTLTPTPTPIAQSSPTLTPSVCPVPGKLMNVRIECPYCQ